MAVISDTSTVRYIGNGATTIFPITFAFRGADTIRVLLNSELTVDYSISGSDVVFNTAPEAGDVVFIRRLVPLTQEKEYPPNDTFPSRSHEDALDKLTFGLQQVSQDVSKAIRLPDDATEDGQEVLDDLLTSFQEIEASTALAVASASAASASEINASTSETNASASASAASTSATNASNSASSASTSATNASNSASSASTSATNASNSATSAAISNSNAGVSATNAGSSAIAAANSATSAANSATSATNSASGVENSLVFLNTIETASLADMACFYSDFKTNIHKIVAPYGPELREIDQVWSLVRATAGSYVDGRGNIVVAPSEKLRVSNGGLLVEPERTNLARWSEDYTDVLWDKLRVSITPNAIIAPDGTLSGAKLVEDTTPNNDHHMRGYVDTLASTTYTTSVYLKAGERTFARLQHGNFAGQIDAQSIRIDLSNGIVEAVHSGDNTRIGIESAGNGWWRVHTTNTTIGDVSNIRPSVFIVANSFTGPLNYNGDGTSGIYVWGLQTEVGHNPSSYIKTEASAVTRTADQVSRVAEGDFPVNDFVILCEFDWNYNTANTDQTIFRLFANVSGIRCRGVGQNFSLILPDENPTDNDNLGTLLSGRNRLGLRRKGLSLEIWLNGNKVLTRAITFTDFKVTSASLGRAASSAGHMNRGINFFGVYRELSDGIIGGWTDV